MRNAFAAEVTALAGEDKRIVLLSGDIGNRLFDEYKALFPQRFLNCGVAEQNMASMAAGMALCGLRPVIYTITPFATTRCLEQIRDDICYQNVPVVIVGVGGGLSYAGLGATHHSCEDIALLRVLPGMAVVCPGDAMEVRQAIRAAVRHARPVYLRIGKKGEPVVHRELPAFAIGKAITLRQGTDVCLLSTGNMLPVAVDAAEELAKHAVSARVESFHTVKPLDEELLHDVCERYAVVVTIEEHSRMGGLGGSIAEWLADHPSYPARLVRVGTADRFLHEAGEQEHARRCYGLTAEEIVRQVRHAYWGCRSGGSVVQAAG